MTHSSTPTPPAPAASGRRAATSLRFAMAVAVFATSSTVRAAPQPAAGTGAMSAASAMLDAPSATVGTPSPEPTPAAPTTTATPFPPLGALEKPIGRALYAEPTAVVIASSRLAAGDLREVYAQRAYEPLWTQGSLRPRIEGLLAVLDDTTSHGLDPRDYHVEQIRTQLDAAQTGDPQAAVALDLLASDAALRLTRHLRDGRSPPPIGDKEASFPREAMDPAAVLTKLAGAADLRAALAEAAPTGAEYARLRKALATYRQAARAGGWNKIPEGPAIRPGNSDPVIPSVRRRLAATGELHGTDLTSRSYDAELERSVVGFQERQGLAGDAIISKATRAALSVDVYKRIEQILVNLERLRWLGTNRGERYIFVNVPTYKLQVIDRGEVVLEMPVVVGKPKLRTPSFSSAVNQVVFNPAWDVPRSIITKEILPKAASDSEYLAREGFVVRRTRARASADPDDPESPPSHATVLGLRQPPGPRNPLGRVKFLMPNDFGVYLHDSPSRSYFAQPTRTYSHGCVRLGRAMALADLVMADQAAWTEDRRKKILGGWTTQYFPLEKPIPVHLVYQTAWADPDGLVHFRNDPYGRDTILLAELPDAALPGMVEARAEAVARPASAPGPH